MHMFLRLPPFRKCVQSQVGLLLCSPPDRLMKAVLTTEDSPLRFRKNWMGATISCTWMIQSDSISWW